MPGTLRHGLLRCWRDVGRDPSALDVGRESSDVGELSSNPSSVYCDFNALARKITTMLKSMLQWVFLSFF